MDFTALMTALTTIFSVAVKVVGMPSQIKYNHRRRSTSGLSSWFVISTLISYVLWVVHGVEVHDDSLIIGQGLGVVVTAIIVVQMFAYRKSEPKATTDVQNSSRPPLLWYSLMQMTTYRKKTKERQLSPGE